MFDWSQAMRFHSLGYPLQVVGVSNRSRASRQDPPCTIASSSSSSPSSPANPPPIILQTDRKNCVLEYRNSGLRSYLMGSSSGAPVFSKPNTVGVIGGVSSISTLSFLEKLVRWSGKEGEGSPPFIVCSEPVLNRELSLKERCSLPYRSKRSGCFQFDKVLLVENLRHKRVFLEHSGARCIVMPCHISHAWHCEISNGCSVPFLHVGECVANELKAANLRPFEAGSRVKIGVLATDAASAAGIYHEKLENLGFEVVSPDKATMDHAVIPAVEALNRKDLEGARTLLRIALQVLLVRAANTIILASDDVRRLLPADDPLLRKCIDPMDALVRSTIEWTQSTEDTH